MVKHCKKWILYSFLFFFIFFINEVSSGVIYQSDVNDFICSNNQIHISENIGGTVISGGEIAAFYDYDNSRYGLYDCRLGQIYYLDGPYGFDSDNYAVGGNLAIFIVPERNLAYVYNTKKASFDVVSIDGESYEGVGDGPYSTFAGGTGAGFVSHRSSGGMNAFFYSYYNEDWKKISVENGQIIADMGEGVGLAIVDYGTTYKKYVYKPTLSTLEQSNIGSLNNFVGELLDIDVSFSNYVYCVGAIAGNTKCLYGGCDGDCICGDSLDEWGVFEENNFRDLGAGEGFIMVSFENGVLGFNKDDNGVDYSNYITPPGEFFNLSVGGKYGAEIRSASDESPRSFVVYDSILSSFVNYGFLPIEEYFTIPYLESESILAGYDALSISTVFDDGGFNMIGYNGDGFFTEDAIQSNEELMLINSNECASDGSDIKSVLRWTTGRIVDSNFVLENTHSFEGLGWQGSISESRINSPTCNGYECCSGYGVIPDSQPSLLFNPSLPSEIFDNQALEINVIVSDGNLDCGDDHHEFIWSITYPDGTSEVITNLELDDPTRLILSGEKMALLSGEVEGTLVINLRVEDRMGLYAIEEININVIEEITNVAPVAQIGAIFPNPSLMNIPISFSGFGTDSIGDIIMEYEWSIDGQVVSTEHSFEMPLLELGVHDVKFRVKDSELWSTYDLEQIEIVDMPNLGENWEQSFISSFNLNGVSCDGNYCIAVGDGGTVLFSYDNGLNWEDITFPFDYALLDVYTKDGNVFVSTKNKGIFKSPYTTPGFSMKKNIFENVYYYIKNIFKGDVPRFSAVSFNWERIYPITDNLDFDDWVEVSPNIFLPSEWNIANDDGYINYVGDYGNGVEIMPSSSLGNYQSNYLYTELEVVPVVRYVLAGKGTNFDGGTWAIEIENSDGNSLGGISDSSFPSGIIGNFNFSFVSSTNFININLFPPQNRGDLYNAYYDLRLFPYSGTGDFPPPLGESNLGDIDSFSYVGGYGAPSTVEWVPFTKRPISDASGQGWVPVISSEIPLTLMYVVDLSDIGQIEADLTDCIDCPGFPLCGLDPEYYDSNYATFVNADSYQLKLCKLKSSVDANREYFVESCVEPDFIEGGIDGDYYVCPENTISTLDTVPNYCCGYSSASLDPNRKEKYIVSGENGFFEFDDNFNPSWVSSNKNFNFLSCVDDYGCFGVRENILSKFYPSGFSWIIENNIISNNGHFNDISFIDQNEGFVVGKYGKVLSTLDGGINWDEDFDLTSDKEGLYGFGKSSYPYGGMVVTEIGGTSLNDIYAVFNDNLIDTSNYYEPILAHYDGNGWGIVDFGETLNFGTSGYGHGGIITDFWSDSPDNVYVSIYGQNVPDGELGIFHYDGESWTYLEDLTNYILSNRYVNPYNHPYSFKSMKIVGSLDGNVYFHPSVGNIIFKWDGSSSDHIEMPISGGGNTWAYYPPMIFSAGGISSNNLFTIAQGYDAGAVAWKYDGSSWVNLGNPVPNYFNIHSTIVVSDEGNIYFKRPFGNNIGEGKNFYEFSGGSWSEIIQSGIPNEISIFGKSHILAENDIYTCGQYKVDHYNGDTWEEISTIGVLSNKLSSFWRWGEHTFVGGDYGEFKYNDGTDSTWYDALEVIFPEGLVDLNAIDFKNNDVIYIVGDNGEILKQESNGERIVENYPGDIFLNLNDVEILQDDTSLIVGDLGSVMKSVDLSNSAPVVEIFTGAGISSSYGGHPQVNRMVSSSTNSVTFSSNVDDSSTPEEHIIYQWSITFDSDGIKRDLDGSQTLEIEDIRDFGEDGRYGLATVMLEAIDFGGLSGADQVSILIKPIVPIKPISNIVQIIADPYNDEFQQLEGTNYDSLAVSGCQNLIFEGEGCDNPIGCSFDVGDSDYGFILTNNWELGGNSIGDSDIFSYSANNLLVSGLSSNYFFQYSVLDNDGMWSDFDDDFVSSYAGNINKIKTIDLDLIDMIPGKNYCEPLCCPDGGCKDSSLFIGDNTASNGPCCGDDPNEYYVTTNGNSKCCLYENYIVDGSGCSRPDNLVEEDGLVKNPSFELDGGFDLIPFSDNDDDIAGNNFPDGWETNDKTKSRMDGSEVYSGDSSIMIFDESSYVNQRIPTREGYYYKVSGMIKTGCGVEGCFGTMLTNAIKDDDTFDWSSNCKLNIDSEDIQRVYGVSDWTEIEFVVKHEGCRDDVRLLVNCYNTPPGGASGIVWCDDISVEESRTLFCDPGYNEVNGICVEILPFDVTDGVMGVPGGEISDVPAIDDPIVDDPVVDDPVVDDPVVDDPIIIIPDKPSKARIEAATDPELSPSGFWNKIIAEFLSLFVY